MKQIPQVLMLACGALSREIEALKRQNQMHCWTVRALGSQSSQPALSAGSAP